MQIDREYVDFGIIIGSRIFFEKMQDTQFDNNFSTQTRKLVPQNSVINLQDLTQWVESICIWVDRPAWQAEESRAKSKGTGDRLFHGA